MGGRPGWHGRERRAGCGDTEYPHVQWRTPTVVPGTSYVTRRQRALSVEVEGLLAHRGIRSSAGARQKSKPLHPELADLAVRVRFRAPRERELGSSLPRLNPTALWSRQTACRPDFPGRSNSISAPYLIPTPCHARRRACFGDFHRTPVPPGARHCGPALPTLGDPVRSRYISGALGTPCRGLRVASRWMAPPGSSMAYRSGRRRSPRMGPRWPASGTGPAVWDAWGGTGCRVPPASCAWEPGEGQARPYNRAATSFS